LQQFKNNSINVTKHS